MLKSFLLYLSKIGWARRMVSGWPIARRAASRFVAGDSPEDALSAIKTLNTKGLYTTLDQLGEDLCPFRGFQI